MDTGDDRQTLITKHADLIKEVAQLRTELAAYSEQDPVEMEKKAAETQKAKMDAGKYTDQIYSMESWLRGVLAGDKEQIDNTLKMLYGDEYDEESESLRET